MFVGLDRGYFRLEGAFVRPFSGFEVVPVTAVLLVTLTCFQGHLWLDIIAVNPVDYIALGVYGTDDTWFRLERCVMFVQ